MGLKRFTRGVAREGRCLVRRVEHLGRFAFEADDQGAGLARGHFELHLFWLWINHSGFSSRPITGARYSTSKVP